MISASTATDETDRTAANSSWGLPHLCVVIFAVSFVMFAVSTEGRLADLSVPFGGEAVRVARSLAVNGRFENPFASMNTGPTAHVAPVYPFIYALFLKVLGTGYTSLWALWAVNIGFLALQMSLLPWLSQRLGFGILPGLLAAALGSLSLHAPVDTRTECFLAGLLLMAACLLTEHVPLWGSIIGAMCLGVFWGVVILTNPVMVLLLAAWPSVSILAQPRERRGRLTIRFAVMACAALLTIAPWIARNYIRMGAFIFVRDNLGLELYTGNNPCAKATLAANIKSGCHDSTHPNSNGAIAANLSATGEYSFNRAKLREANLWIGSNRPAFLILTAQRFRQFWWPDLDHLWETIPVWTITVFGIAGLFLMRRKPFAWLIGTAWVLFPTVYYFVPSEPRYRYPIYWTSLLPAGYAVAEALVWSRVSTSRLMGIRHVVLRPPTLEKRIIKKQPL